MNILSLQKRYLTDDEPFASCAVWCGAAVAILDGIGGENSAAAARFGVGGDAASKKCVSL